MLDGPDADGGVMLANPVADQVRVEDRIRFRAQVYDVVGWQGARLLLRPVEGDADLLTVLYAVVVAAADFAVLDRRGREAAPLRLRERAGQVEALPEAVRVQALFWQRHIRQVRHESAPGVPAGHRPSPEYDPARRTLRERCQTKAEQLQALGVKVQAGTLEDKCRAWASEGLLGLVDGRKVRLPSPYGRTDARSAELLWVALGGEWEESAGGLDRLLERWEALVRDRFPAAVADEKLKRRFLPSRATRYRLLARIGITVKVVTAPTARRNSHSHGRGRPNRPTLARVPGEVVQIDTTGLDVLCFGDDGLATSVELTVVLDVATRSIMGALIVPRRTGVGGRAGPGTGRATRSLDAVLTLAQALAPIAAKPGWSELTLMRGSDLPYEDLLEGDPQLEGAAARPVIWPSTVVIDQGRAFKGSVFLAACRQLGVFVQFARSRTPTDKAIVERAMRRIKSRFSQWVAGYTSTRIDLRARRLNKLPLFTVNQLQELLDQWVVLDWQQTPHQALRDPHMPGRVLTPNQMYAAMIAQRGTRARPLTPEENRKLLPEKWVTVNDKGLRLNNRTYNLPQGLPVHGPSGLPGRKGSWEAHYNPYQPQVVWLHNHRAGPGQDPWIEVPFVFQHLIGDAWTEAVWEHARARFLADGGNARDQAAVARAVRGLLTQARKGAKTALKHPELVSMYTGPKVETAGPSPDPYAGLPVIDPDMLRTFRSLDDPGRVFAQVPAPTPQAEPDPPAPPSPAAGTGRLPQPTLLEGDDTP